MKINLKQLILAIIDSIYKFSILAIISIAFTLSTIMIYSWSTPAFLIMTALFLTTIYVNYKERGD